MKKNVQLKPINTTELEFKNQIDYLQWREQILIDYEKSKISYKKEMEQLFGYLKEQEN